MKTTTTKGLISIALFLISSILYSQNQYITPSNAQDYEFTIVVKGEMSEATIYQLRNDLLASKQIKKLVKIDHVNRTIFVVTDNKRLETFSSIFDNYFNDYKVLHQKEEVYHIVNKTQVKN